MFEVRWDHQLDFGVIIQGPTNTFTFWCPFGTLASKFWWPGSQIQWPEKKITLFTIHNFFVRAIGVSHHITVCHTQGNSLPAGPGPIAVERIERDASRIYVGQQSLYASYFAFLFLVSLSPHVKPNFFILIS